MSVLDFPSAPIDGQVYYATGAGISYQWRATPGLWVATGYAAPLPGDFMARLDAAVPGWNGTASISSYMSAITGNAGGWFVKGAAGTGGRFTPPPGRYLILGNVSLSSNAALVSCSVQMTKNGGYLDGSYAYTPAVNANINMSVQAEVDANGSDWFDLQLTAAGASQTVHIGSFLAIPILGPVTQQIPKGVMTLYSEQVIVTPAPSMSVLIPPAAKSVELQFGMETTSSFNDGLNLRAIVSGTPYTGNTHTTMDLTAVNGSVTGLHSLAQSSWILSGGAVCSGSWKTSSLNGGGAFGTGYVFGQAVVGEFLVNGTRRTKTITTDSGPPGATSLITGFQVYGPSNFKAGAYLRALVTT